MKSRRPGDRSQCKDAFRREDDDKGVFRAETSEGYMPSTSHIMLGSTRWGRRLD